MITIHITYEYDGKFSYDGKSSCDEMMNFHPPSTYLVVVILFGEKNCQLIGMSLLNPTRSALKALAESE